MRAVIGIGNPGSQYEGTRHNLGFAVVDLLAREAQGQWRERWHAQVMEWTVPQELGGGQALLMKPQTYVNASGEAVQAAMTAKSMTPLDCLVVVDDLNLALGHLRLRADGSAGGHNGLRDIEARIGKAYPRLRLGMGPMPPGADQVRFVLSRFEGPDVAAAQAMIARAASCVREWLAEGVKVACRYNGPPVPPEPPIPRAAP